MVLERVGRGREQAYKNMPMPLEMRNVSVILLNELEDAEQNF